jgi:hypothetical protein
VRIRAETYRATAKEHRNKKANISPQDARDTIEKDCFGIWSRQTILDVLPDEAKNPEKQKAGHLMQKERYSAAFFAAQKLQDNMEVVIDVEGRA